MHHHVDRKGARANLYYNNFSIFVNGFPLVLTLKKTPSSTGVVGVEL